MKDLYGLSSANIPAAYVHLLLDILIERGIAIDQLKKACKLPAHLTPSDDTRLSTKQWTRLILGAIALTQDEGLGCVYGSRVKITTHGVMGFALLSSPTLGAALDLISQFFSMRVRSYQIDIQTIGDQTTILLEENHPIVGLPQDQALVLKRFLHEAVLLSCVEGLRFLTAESDMPIMLGVSWDEPAYYQRYQSILPEMRFNQLHASLRFPSRYLSSPIATSNPIAYQFALEQCQREDINFPASAQSKENLAERIRALLILEPQVGYPTLTRIASVLNLSERTLKRHLEMEGVSFITLLNAQKEADAIKILQETDFTIQSISERFGYASSINFSRAFKRWTGLTPSEFRERQSEREPR